MLLTLFLPLMPAGGRFSGRLAKKEDEELLVTECELLAPLVSEKLQGSVRQRSEGAGNQLSKRHGRKKSDICPSQKTATCLREHDMA
jgi:hypothetical protein